MFVGSACQRLTLFAIETGKLRLLKPRSIASISGANSIGLQGPVQNICPTHQSSDESDQSKTIFRRPLPMHLVSFNSSAGKKLFQESMNMGYADIYFQLVGNFTAQSHPTYCGLGSLAMVLNAVEMDPGRRWKGIWRWYSDENLECCAPREEVQKRGVSFREFACLARCNGLKVTAKRAPHFSLDEFAQDLRFSAKSTNTHIVVNFSRRALGQTGGGHFSPIGAYHPSSLIAKNAESNLEERGMVLVLDTARFKYPSYFADVKALYEAMQDVDPDTNLPRGYFLLQKSVSSAPMSICKLSSQPAVSWDLLGKFFCSRLPQQLSKISPKSAEEVVEATLLEIPESYRYALQLPHYPGVDRAGNYEQHVDLQSTYAKMISELMGQVKCLPIYSVVKRTVERNAKLRDTYNHADSEELQLVLTTILLLSIPSEAFAVLNSTVLKGFESLRTLGNEPTPNLLRHFEAAHGLKSVTCSERAAEKDQVGFCGQLLKREVSRIYQQLESLMQSFCECGRKPNRSSSKQTVNRDNVQLSLACKYSSKAFA